MTNSVWESVLADVWANLPYADSADGGVPSIVGDRRLLPALPSGLAVDELAVGSVTAALRAGALLATERIGKPPPAPSLSASHVADAVRSERFLRVPGREAVSGFAPLSRFWLTGRGWLRTHANYPWHLAALLRALVLPDGEGAPEKVAAVLLTDSALNWEERITRAGGVAAAVRTPAEWAASEAGAAVEKGPLVRSERIGSAAPAPVPDRMRVLDLTRVIAGPVASRTLGAFGADVLRLDPPDRRELDSQQTEGLLGKRSALLDVVSADGRAKFHELLQSADVLLYGYRPGSSALDAQRLAERYPGLVIGQLSAWGEQGPWGRRRGFDSLVQAASGIAHLQADRDGRPGVLPCQLLDHATGYLMAASALLALRERSRTGGSHLVHLSLAATARQLLTTTPAPLRGVGEDPETVAIIEDWTAPIRMPTGETVFVVTPPGAFGGLPLRWPEPVAGYGQDSPGWNASG